MTHRLQLSTAPKAKTVETIAGDTEERITSKLKKRRSKPIITLPRTLEVSVLQANPNVKFVCGIDEAGRGPTASDPMNMWAIAVIDAATIDEINVIQATLLGLRMVASVMTGRAIKYPTVYINEFESEQTLPGCFVLVPNGVPLQEQLPMDTERGQYQFVDHRIMH